MIPELSVVVCTRNRVRSLARCIDGLAAVAPRFPFEMIVVDNGSSDGTSETVAARANDHAWLRCVAEPVAGLSRARNRGAAAATSALLAYVDDDAEPQPGWAEGLRSAFEDGAAAVVGGPILPRFEGGNPGPITRAKLGAWSCQDLGPARRAVVEFPYLFGANLAVRRDHLERLGGFDEGFGRKGASLLSGEDTDLCERTRAAGGLLRYEPSAVVHHWISPERLSDGFLRRRAMATGRTRALQMSRTLPAATIAASLAGKLLKLPAHLAAWGVARAAGKPEAIDERIWSVFATLGLFAHFVGPQKVER
jgi:GT2 family glycosyltransferase